MCHVSHSFLILPYLFRYTLELIVVQLGLLLSIKLSMKLLFVALMRWDGSLRLDRSSKKSFSGALRVYLTGPCKFFRFGINVYGPFAESSHHSFRWWNFVHKRGIMGVHDSFIYVSLIFLAS